jgi:metal-sulfur cluster biosynthetic enzyme
MITTLPLINPLLISIQDPEKDQTLDELNVVAEHLIDVKKTDCDEYLINVNFTPTVPHCSLATLIGKHHLL